VNNHVLTHTHTLTHSLFTHSRTCPFWPLHFTHTAHRRALTAATASEATRLAAARCVATALHRVDPLEPTLAVSSAGALALSLDASATPQLASAPAELRTSVINTIRDLVSRFTLPTWLALESDAHLPVLGHLISVLLTHGTAETVGVTPLPRQLRVDSIGVLRAVIAGVPSPSRLATFLPGIASALGRVVTGDFKQGLAVFEAAVTCWGEVVVKVMADSNRRASGRKGRGGGRVNNANEGLGSDGGGGSGGSGSGGAAAASSPLRDNTDEDNDNDNGDEGKDSRRLVTRQDDAWWTTTADNLKAMVEKIARVGRHESWRVRLAAVG
jgi:hypothetical protein